MAITTAQVACLFVPPLWGSSSFCSRHYKQAAPIGAKNAIRVCRVGLKPAVR